ESYILLLFLLYFWQVDIELMCLGVVIVHAVTGKASERDIVVFLIPVVDRQHNVFLVQAPTVRQLGDEGAINHIPKFLVVLQFLIQYGIEYRATFTDCVASKFRENI